MDASTNASPRASPASTKSLTDGVKNKSLTKLKATSSGKLSKKSNSKSNVSRKSSSKLEVSPKRSSKTSVGKLQETVQTPNDKEEGEVAEEENESMPSNVSVEEMIVPDQADVVEQTPEDKSEQAAATTPTPTPTQKAIPSFSNYMSEEREKELKSVFKIFDVHNNGMVPVRQLGTVIRAAGLHPTEEEVYMWCMDVDKAGNGTFQFSDFKSLVGNRMKPLTELEDIVKEALKTFDKERTGIISSEKLRHIMTTMGDCLSKEEVEEFMQTVDSDFDGIVHIDEVVTIFVHS